MWTKARNLGVLSFFFKIVFKAMRQGESDGKTEP